MIIEYMNWMWRFNNDEFKDWKGMYYTEKFTVQCGEFLFLWITYARVVRNDFHLDFFVKLEKDSA